MAHATRQPRCLGSVGDHLLLLAGLGCLLIARVLVVAANGVQPLGRAIRLGALVIVPALALIARMIANEHLNPADGAWDGRPLPITLALQLITPAVVAFALCALRRANWPSTLALTAACVALSFALPLTLIIAGQVVSGGGS